MATLGFCNGHMPKKYKNAHGKFKKIVLQKTWQIFGLCNEHMEKNRNFLFFQRWEFFGISKKKLAKIFKMKNQIQNILASKYIANWPHLLTTLVSSPLLHSVGHEIEPPPTHLSMIFFVGRIKERAFVRKLVTTNDSKNWHSSSLASRFVPGYRMATNKFAARMFPTNVCWLSFLKNKQVGRMVIMRSYIVEYC